MKTRLYRALLTVAIGTSCVAHAEQSDIGSDLYEKQAVSGDSVPAQALESVRKLQPGFELREAESESKHGNQYLDLEGVTAEGKEIEFDMLLNEQNLWEVVEIQRDLSLDECPQPVRELYHEHFEAPEPQRIIESKQMDGLIIYELYFVEAGQTTKSEIKLDGDTATLLEEEWTH